MVETTLNEYVTGNLHTVVAIAQIRILNISIGFGGKKMSVLKNLSIPSSISKTLPSESLFFISRHL